MVVQGWCPCVGCAAGCVVLNRVGKVCGCWDQALGKSVGRRCIDLHKWQRGCVTTLNMQRRVPREHASTSTCMAVCVTVVPCVFLLLLLLYSLIQLICSIFVVSWSGVVQFHGVRPKALKGQSPGGRRFLGWMRRVVCRLASVADVFVYVLRGVVADRSRRCVRRKSHVHDRFHRAPTARLLCSGTFSTSL